MFHPVGPQPPSVYWRRRLLVIGSLIVLIILLVMTIKVLTSDGSAATGAQGGASTSTGRTTSDPPATTPATSTAPPTSHSASSSAGSPSGSKHSSAPPPTCAQKDLSVSAVTGKSSYHVGDQPLLQMQVVNTGSVACVQDLADKQVELRVYNGESRVWGSHDCQVEPGMAVRTLAPNQPVRVAITWSGLSSRPHCAGTRQRVGAGTYTLYAVLSGKTGKAAQFSIG
jgi:hypothetical protein